MERDERPVELPTEDRTRLLEHLLALLSVIVPRQAFDAAVQGVRSPIAGVRGLAREYLDQVLPPVVLNRLRLIATASSADDAQRQSAAPPPAITPSGPR